MARRLGGLHSWQIAATPRWLCEEAESNSCQICDQPAGGRLRGKDIPGGVSDAASAMAHQNGGHGWRAETIGIGMAFELDPTMVRSGVRRIVSPDVSSCHAVSWRAPQPCQWRVQCPGDTRLRFHHRSPCGHGSSPLPSGRTQGHVPTQHNGVAVVCIRRAWHASCRKPTEALPPVPARQPVAWYPRAHWQRLAWTSSRQCHEPGTGPGPRTGTA